MTTLYTVTDPKTEKLIMIAPLATLRDVFRLHDSALDRIEIETAMGTCEIFFNYGRTQLGFDKIVIETYDPRCAPSEAEENVRAENDDKIERRLNARHKREAKARALVAENRDYVLRPDKTGALTRVWCSSSDHEVEF